MNIGDLIKEKRLEKGYSQEELARVLYVSNKTISKWETKRSIPNVDMLLPLCKVLNIDLNAVIGYMPNENTMLKKLKRKRRQNILQLIVGIVVCFVLCALEVILYMGGISEKFAYFVFGLVFFLFVIFDIVLYFMNKDL